jgi:excisionase family DNA binding protein
VDSATPLPERPWLTVKQAAQRLQISESTLLRALRNGTCQGVKISNRRTWRLRWQWADAFLEAQSPDAAERQSLRLATRP